MLNCDRDLTIVGHRISVPPQLCTLVRKTSCTNTLSQIGKDIWVTFAAVAPHTDGTAEGLITYGFIIANDPNYTFVHDGREYAIPSGTLYRMDGRIEHATYGGPGLLAALIWDMPPVWDLSDFAAELANEHKM